MYVHIVPIAVGVNRLCQVVGCLFDTPLDVFLALTELTHEVIVMGKIGILKARQNGRVLRAKGDCWSWNKSIFSLMGGDHHLALLVPPPGGEAKVLEEDQEEQDIKEKSSNPLHIHK